VNRREPISWTLAALPATLFVLLPLLALSSRTDVGRIGEVLSRSDTREAILLSLRTTAISVAIVGALGLPLAYFIATRKSWFSRLVDTVSDLPIVLPPAAAGVALIVCFGRSGWIGEPAHRFGLQITFTSIAVVIAQCFVALPFFVRSAVEGLRKVDQETVLAGAVDGASFFQGLGKIILPQCRAALAAGLLLAWARALGEFGATLMFAGSFVGKTQTVPLAIYAGFDSDLDVAVALSVVLLALAALVLTATKLWIRR
jgi:molybdate transport system permease protein